jgi:hypothetical protein
MEDEKYNIWVVYVNLENDFGDQNTLDEAGNG